MPENEAKEEQKADKGMERRKSRFNFVLALLSLCVSITIPMSAVLGSQAYFEKLSDFPEYYGAMKLLAEGKGEQIYVLDSLFEKQHLCFPQMEGRGIAYYIPPFATPLLAWMGLMQAKTAFLIFILLSAASLLASAFILGKHFKLGATGSLWLLTLICATSPAFESLKIAQLAPFLLLSLAGFLHFQSHGKDLKAGLCLSILLMKPQELLPLAVYLLAAGKNKIVLNIAAAAAVLGLTSLPLLGGSKGYANYIALLKDSAANTQFMQPELSATLRGQLMRAGELGAALANSLSLAVMLICLVLIAYGAFKKAKTAAQFETGLLTFALPLGLISSLHCHDYDLLLLFPWFAAVYVQEKESLIAKLNLFGLFLLSAALTIPFYVPIHYFWLMQEKRVFNPLFALFLIPTLISSYRFLSTEQNSSKEQEKRI